MSKDRDKFIKLHTPSWANIKLIAQLYKLSKSMGCSYCVDHSVPLKSEYVCGLHCIDNLEIIHVKINAKKSNIVWPDSWNYQIELELEYVKEHQLELNL